MVRALLVVAATVACGDVGTTVRIVDCVDGELSTRDVELTTMHDLATVDGEAARMWGGSTVSVEPSRAALDGGTLREQYLLDPAPVRVAWVADGDVAVPTDFDSLAMLTAYAHFETVSRHFMELGIAVADDPVPVYYNPSVDKPDSVSFPEYDNAAYFPEADGFLVFPAYVLQQLPLAMNLGVIGHEYSHRVLYFRLWGGERFASIAEHSSQPGSLNAWNRLWATDEGVADFFGAAVAGDPNYLAASTPPEVAEPRDLAVERHLDPGWVTGRQPEGENGEYARYIPGAVVAATLWRISEIAGLMVTERAVLAAQAALYDQVRNNFEYEFGDLEARVIAELPAASRGDACAALEPRYQPVWSAFSAVCP